MYLFTLPEDLIKENALHKTAGSWEHKEGDGKSESVSSLQKVREVVAVMEQ